jgi:hypothetical protein
MIPPTVEQFLSALIQEPVDDDGYELKKWRATNFLISCAQSWQEMVVNQSLEKDVRLRAAQCAGAVREELKPC